MTAVAEKAVRDILESEPNNTRFEDFGRAVSRIIHGHEFARTSTTWDLGRDGFAPDAPGYFVGATLEGKQAKFDADASRIASTTETVELFAYFIAKNVIKSEAARDRLAAAMQKLCPQAKLVQIYDQNTIVSLINDNHLVADRFQYLYAAELRSLQELYRPDTSRETRSLELALATYGSENTGDLFREINQTLILTCLESKSCSYEELSLVLNSQYGIESYARGAYDYHLNALKNQGLVTAAGPRYEMTPAGRDRLASSRGSAAASVVAGSVAVRAAVQKSLEFNLSNDQWSRVYTALQRALAEQLYLKGHELLSIISRIMAERDEGAAPASALPPSGVGDATIQTTIERIATRTAKESHDATVVYERIRQAVMQAFLPDSPAGAFEWLTAVCAGYVAVCASGLDPSVREALELTLRRFRFVFDTHVVVSAMCPHDIEHWAANSVRDLSKRFGHTIVVPYAVVEETARHAMKAHVDYAEQVANSKKPLAWFDLPDLESAFTREFESLRIEGKVRAHQWDRWIQRFTGPVTRDPRTNKLRPNVAKMQEILRAEGYAVFASVAQDARHAERVRQYAGDVFQRALSRDPEADSEILKEKSRIDAEAILTLDRAVTDGLEAGKDERYLLVTSGSGARWLANEVARARKDSNQHIYVLTVAEAAYLAALLPASAFSVRSLGMMLFDDGLRSAFGAIEKKLFRALRDVESASVPGAVKGILAVALDEKITSYARERGLAVGEVKRQVRRQPVLLAQLAATGIEALGLQNAVQGQHVIERLGELEEKIGAGGGLDSGESVAVGPEPSSGPANSPTPVSQERRRRRRRRR